MGLPQFVDLSLLASLNNYSLAARYVCEGVIGGSHKSAYVGYNSEFSHHREYMPGDEIRHVDWKRFAKTGKYYIKQYEESSSLNAMILLDDSDSMRIPSKEGLQKNIYARILTSSLCWLLLKQRDGVGFVRFAESMTHFLPLTSKMTRFSELCSLLDSEPSSGKTNLVKTLDQTLPLLKKKCMFILISDFLEDEESLKAAVERIAFYGHEIIAFHLLTAEELTFPWDEFSEFHDLESEEILTMEAKSAKEEYQKNLRYFLAETEGHLRQHQADYQLLRTSYPIEKALTHFLYRRSRHA